MTTQLRIALILGLVATTAAHAASWHAVATLPDAASEGRSIALRDGDVLHVTATGPCELFRTATATWQRLPGLRHPRGGFRLARLNDGRVLAIGGTDPANDDHALATTEVFDPLLRAWSDTGAMLTARRGAVAVTLIDGRVLVAGGVGRTAAVDDPKTPYDDTEYPGGWFRGRLPLVELYDPATGRWRASAALRYAHASAEALRLADGRVLVYGGWTDRGAAEFQQPIAEVFDPRAGQWTTTVNDAYDADFTTEPPVLLADGRVAVLDARLPYADLQPGARVLDPHSLRWSPFASIGPRGASAVALDDGVVLASGGEGIDADGYPQPIASAELLERGSSGWHGAAAMQHARVGHELIRLPGERALAIGGDGAGTCEVYLGSLPLAGAAPVMAWVKPPTAVN